MDVVPVNDPGETEALAIAISLLFSVFYGKQKRICTVMVYSHLAEKKVRTI